MRIRIAVAEDSAPDAQQLHEYIRRFESGSRHSFEVKIYPDGDDLVAHYKAQFDIILMNVEMPRLDGITAAGHIRQMDPEVAIIFITATPQYAIQGYAVNALDYMLKPLDYAAFSHRLELAVQQVRRRKRAYLIVPVKGGMVKLEVSGIYYVESLRHQLTYCTDTGDHVNLSGSINQAEEVLIPHGFFRCNKGCLVNLEHVERVQDECAVVNGTPLPISRRKQAAFLEALRTHAGRAAR